MLQIKVFETREETLLRRKDPTYERSTAGCPIRLSAVVMESFMANQYYQGLGCNPTESNNIKCLARTYAIRRASELHAAAENFVSDQPAPQTTRRRHPSPFLMLVTGAPPRMCQTQCTCTVSYSRIGSVLGNWVAGWAGHPCHHIRGPDYLIA